MIKKKGLEQSALVKIIGIVASFIILALLFQNIFGITYGESAETICRLSVISHAKTQVAGSPIMNIKCPRKFISIDDEGYKRYYADELPIDKDKLTRQEKFKEDKPVKQQVYKLMADEMAECWYKMGEGKLDIFAEDTIKTRAPCMICSEIGFSKEFDKSINLGTIEEFERYLKENNFTKYGLDKEYHDFLYDNYPSSFSINHLAYFIEAESVQIAIDGTADISPEENYFISFKAYKFDKITAALNYAGEKIAGESINRVFPNDRSYIFLAPQKETIQSCDMMVN